MTEEQTQRVTGNFKRDMGKQTINRFVEYSQFNHFENILRALSGVETRLLSGVETRCLSKQNRVYMSRFY